MKNKISIIIMVISLGITFYVTIFWQPINTNIVTNEDEAKMVFNSITNDNKDGIENSDNIKTENYKDNSVNVEAVDSIDNSVKSSIFKVEESEIEKKLLKEKKERLKQIIDKMSSQDTIRLKDKINNENKEVGIREAFNLIKLRVSVKDYEEVKEILAEYIDFDAIN